MEELIFIQKELLPELLRGLLVSIKLIIPSAFFGVAIGVLIGIVRVYGNPILKAFAGIYVLVFRGFPLLIQLYLLYFGLPHLGIYFEPYTACVVGFSLCGGAYHSEYVRGSLQSIKKGQLLGAYSLGFSKIKTVFNIVLPQALRLAMPGIGNELIYLIKYSSLSYMVTCIELTGEGKIIASNTFKYIEVFLVVGALYLIVVSIATWILHGVEDKLSIAGFEHPRD